MNNESIQTKRSKIDFLLEKIKSPSIKKQQEVSKVVVPTINFYLIEKINSPKIIPLLELIKRNGVVLNQSEQIKRIANYAISNKITEIIEELISLNIDLNQKIDHLNSQTILAVIVQYPHFHDLFKTLIEAGANTYYDSQPGSINFHSNALYRSVTYDEFQNIYYLVEKKICTIQEALSACYLQNKVDMIEFFLENISQEDILIFKEYVIHTSMSRRVTVLSLIKT